MKRRYPRRPFQKLIGFRLGESYYLAEAVEISEGGLSFHGLPGFVEGDQITVDIELNSKTLLTLRAQVCNFQSVENCVRYGCRFEQIGFKELRAIQDYVIDRKQLAENVIENSPMKSFEMIEKEPKAPAPDLSSLLKTWGASK